MPIRKRGDHWHVDIKAPDGTRIRHSTGTTNKAQAQEYHDKLKHDLWQQARLGVTPDVLWEDAAARYLKEIEDKKSYRDMRRHIKFWTTHFRGVPIKDITRVEVARIVEAHTDTPATRNRYVATIRALLFTAHRGWELIDKVPAFKTYKLPDGRTRWLSPEEAALLLAVMPAWMRDMAEFSLNTGLRQANVFGLRWDMVDLRLRVAVIPGHMFKSGRRFACHLNDAAVDIIRRQLGKHTTHIFVDAKGREMETWPTTCDRVWRDCLVKAGLSDLRWHDLRHTWASWHVQNGTDIYELQRLGGWETAEMPMRYAHLSAQALQTAAERVTNMAQRK